MESLVCVFCNRLCKNVGGLGAHIKHCKHNPNRIQKINSPNSGARKGRVPWNKGLTQEDARVNSYIQTRKSRLESGEIVLIYKKHSNETKKKISDRMKRQYASGWEPVCGRCKKYEYQSISNGIVKVDGTWELAVAKYLDHLKLNWQRNKKRFEYIKPSGIKSTYQPDFYVSDWGCYIEVKGYETKLDKCKWSQFPDVLIVWKEEKIKQIFKELNDINVTTP